MRRRPRQIRDGDEYTIGERVARVKRPPDPEPVFMGEPWGESDHVPRDRRVVWDEDAQTYRRAVDDGAN